MQVTLAQAGIAAGILTLAWVVGGQQEVYSASSSTQATYPHQVFNSTSKAHAEKVASLVPDSIVAKRNDDGPFGWRVMSKTPYAEARSYFQPWLRENDYFRSNQFLSEVKYEAESFSAEEPKLWGEVVTGSGWDNFNSPCKYCWINWSNGYFHGDMPFLASDDDEEVCIHGIAALNPDGSFLSR